MKKILFTSIGLAACVSAFGQGSIVFENINTSSSGTGVTLNSQAGAKTTSGLVVELLWNNGSTFVVESTYTSTYTGAGGGNPAQLSGFFNAGTVAIPAAGVQTFEVEGTFGGYSGTTAPFTATVNALPAPPGPLAAGGGASAWSGDLVLTPVPEPTTIALSGLGAAALLLFRRRK